MSAVPMPGQPPDPSSIFQTIQSYQRSFVLKAGVDLDVFTAIAKGKKTAAEIAAYCKASERGVRVLCDALTILGFLTKAGADYALTPESAFFLDSRSPAYLGHTMRFLLHPAQRNGVENLSEAVRRGGTEEEQSSLSPEDPIWVDFARNMAQLMVPAAQAIAQLLKPALEKKSVPRVLDIAAGHGTFGITVAEQVPTAQVYAVDWANVLEVAGENARARGVGDRYHLCPGSAFEVDFGTSFAAAMVTNFLHHFDAATNVGLLKKVFSALNPGGELVVLEFVPNEDRISPPIPAMFSVTMLSHTPRGEAFTFADLAEMCRAAGFEAGRLVQLAPMPQSLVLARKPL
jgi:2-polyprenyl-3-methyl-5-hydroxy-6-metoxy-1,4-benzoquinol methylase